MKENHLSFFIFAGEASGDMLGGKLMEALKKRVPSSFWGVGGPEMLHKGIDLFASMEEFQVIGFLEVLFELPRLYSLGLKIIEEILKKNPEAVIFIDSPGFSLRAGQKLRKKGYKGKIIQIVSPTIWAWDKEKRMKTMNSYLDLLLVIYPFEEPFFQEALFKTLYIGHPILEIIEDHIEEKEWENKLFIPFHHFKETLSFFPGSRPSEVRKNLPLMLEVASLIKEKRPSLLILIPCAHLGLMEILYEEIEQSAFKIGENCFIVPKAYTYETMEKSDLVIAKSGTVTLELALHGAPSLVIYNLSKINRFLAEKWFKINLPFYCIVNILFQKEVFPEFIKTEPTIENLTEKALEMLKNKDLRQEYKDLKEDLMNLFSKEKASENGAEAILECLKVL